MSRIESYDRKYGPEGGKVIRRLIATIAARARWSGKTRGDLHLD